VIVRLSFLYISGVLLLTTFAFSQDSTFIPSVRHPFPDSGYVLRTILLHGNEVTKDFVILREMSLKPGSRVTEGALQYDRNRIYSLGLFNNVQLWIQPSTGDTADLLVEVHERWYIFPYPIFGIRDRDLSRVYYGAGLVHTNFRGRDEKLSFSFVLGYNPSIAISYRNPFLDESGTSFFELGLSFNKVRNRSQQLIAGEPDFDERHFSVGLTVGKRFGIEHTTWISAGYEVADLSEHVPLRTLSPSGIDRYPVISAGYSYDTRDLVVYPGYGTLLRATVTKNGLPSDYVNYIRYSADVRHYVPLVGSLVLAGRAFTDVFAAGRLPGYNHVYFGYGERIRGHFREILEGENIFGVSSELHVPIIPIRYFNVGFLPSAFSVWKFGVLASVFGDAGTTWYRGQPLAVNRMLRGYGTGIDVLFAYDAVLRLEYAWNEQRQGQIILDAGASF
jgi:outer membrane protein assembly factor BamA